MRRSAKHRADKIEQVNREVLVERTSLTNLSEEEQYFHEMMQQLKQKFATSSSYNEKMLVLSVVPKSWSISKIATEFNCTQHLARKTKSIVQEHGILCTVQKMGNPIGLDIIDQVFPISPCIFA